MCVCVCTQEYGGYVTSLLVSTKDSPVKCAAVLSPITDFELYGELRWSISCVTGRPAARPEETDVCSAHRLREESV